MTFVNHKNIAQNQAEEKVPGKEDNSAQNTMSNEKSEPASDITKHTILIVDDEKSILKALKRSLADENYRILTAESSMEALRLISSHNVTIVISDYSMPGGTGADLLQIIMREQPRCIRIMLSGAAETDMVPDEIAETVLNCQRFIFKPWSDYQLKIIIRDCISQYETSCMKTAPQPSGE